jgi:dolichol-phosphate mannosyltransferase
VRLGDPSRMFKFGVVGVSGVGVNSFFLWFFTDVAGIHYMGSSPMAVELAVLSNFLLNNYWTFRDSDNRSPILVKMLKFHVTAAGGFAINFVFLVGLTELAGMYYLLSNLVGILAGFLWNYAVNVKWTWSSRAQPPR